MLVRVFCVMTLAAALTIGVGCNTQSGGGGGGGTTGPNLDDYQLDGSNPELEADVEAITTAYNAALACIGDDDITFTEQENLDALKSSFDGAAADFPSYVDESRQLIVGGSDEICTYALGGDPALDALIADITEQRNRGRECMGEEPDLDDENSLAFLKQRYLAQILAFDDLTDAAEGLVSDATLLADDACAEEAP